MKLRTARAAAQLLHRPAGGTPESIVTRLLAVQSQDIVQGRRALRARGEGFTAADVDRAIVEERSIVVAWFNRGTVHMVGRDDYPWLLPLTAATQFTSSRRRLGQLGLPPDAADRAVKVMTRELAADGPLSRRELRERLAAKGIRTKDQAFGHTLFLAALRGEVVTGHLVDGQQGVALTRDWLGIDPPEPDERALAELARRYLVAHGPASDRDLAYWAGLPLRDVRAGLSAIAGELTELDGDLVDLAKREPAQERIPLRLLPMWDAYLLGWKQRDFAAAPAHAGRIWGGGMIGPALTVDGLAVGRWSARRNGDRLNVEVEPFRSRIGKRALLAEQRDLARFEGLEPA